MLESRPPHLPLRSRPGQLAGSQHDGVHDAEGDRHQQGGDAQPARRTVAQLRRTDVPGGQEPEEERGPRAVDRVGAAGCHRRLAAGWGPPDDGRTDRDGDDDAEQ